MLFEEAINGFKNTDGGFRRGLRIEIRVLLVQRVS